MENLFENYGFYRDKLLHVSSKEAYELCLKGAILLDVREEYLNSFKKFDVPYIIYIPLSKIKQNDYKLNKESCFYIVADSAGLRSKEAAKLLLSNNFLNIANMAGGLIEWERANLPLIINNNEKLTGSCMCQLKKHNNNS
ncbi:MAG TPA: rhodanese-like domain-containing protein [Bacteroidales bacterium]|nr:rhodanese-like domain-containing protein [Bacteroidales bacterium]